MELKEPRGDILIVDDTPANLRLLASILHEHGFKIRAVVNGQMALTAAQTAPPDLILLDITMPEMSGYEVCEKLKEDDRTRGIPIIFISALDAIEDKVKAFTTGGVDYITKPFQIEEVVARVKTHLSLRTMQRGLQKANEELLLAHDHLKAKLAENEILRQELREQAIRDPLTGLFNRRYLQERLKQEVARADREGTPICILFMDIDYFKRFNDTYGHKAGDLILQELGALLLQETRKSDTACRYGGEEFIVVMSDISLRNAAHSAELLRGEFEKLAVPFENGEVLRATISIGGASYPENGHSIPDIIQSADEALYAAKSAGRNRVVTCKSDNADSSA